MSFEILFGDDFESKRTKSHPGKPEVFILDTRPVRPVGNFDHAGTGGSTRGVSTRESDERCGSRVRRDLEGARQGVRENT